MNDEIKITKRHIFQNGCKIAIKGEDQYWHFYEGCGYRYEDLRDIVEAFEKKDGLKR